MLCSNSTTIKHCSAGSVVHTLQDAIAANRRVRFRYLHPWKGDSSTVETEPYDLRRQRDRLVLDAGGDGVLVGYDVSGITDVEVLETAFVALVLPPLEARTARVLVVLRVPAYSAEEKRIETGWGQDLRGYL